LVKDFSAKNNATTLQNSPPQYPDPATANFYLFSHLEADLNRPRFCDAIAIIKNAMKELKTFTKCLQRMFPTPLQPLAEVYICTREIIYRILYFSEMK
jgi:hypothetical protein